MNTLSVYVQCRNIGAFYEDKQIAETVLVRLFAGGFAS